jgi:hypothetical protein
MVADLALKTLTRVLRWRIASDKVGNHCRVADPDPVGS